MWLLINSRLFNSVIVFLVLVHCLIIFAELLIDLDVIRDPFQDLNCTVTNFSASFSVTEAINLSTNLLETRKCLSQISLTIVTIFLTEVCNSFSSFTDNLLISDVDQIVFWSIQVHCPTI